MATLSETTECVSEEVGGSPLEVFFSPSPALGCLPHLLPTHTMKLPLLPVPPEGLCHISYIHTQPREFQPILWETVQSFLIFMKISLTTPCELTAPVLGSDYVIEISLPQPVLHSVITASSPGITFITPHSASPSARAAPGRQYRAGGWADGWADEWMHGCTVIV